MFVFFKQKTAYEMRISDWRSDVLLCRSRAWRRTVARVRRPRGGGRGRRHPGRIAPAVEPVEAGGGTVLRDRFRRGAAATRATGGQTGRRGAVGRQYRPGDPCAMDTMNRYAPAMRRIHWLTALLLIAAYLLIEQRNLFPRGSEPRTLMVQGPFWNGLANVGRASWREGVWK